MYDINISKGVIDIDMGAEKVTHYTISRDSRTEEILNNGMVNELAKIIQYLDKHNQPFRIIDDTSGVYHVAFGKLDAEIGVPVIF